MRDTIVFTATNNIRKNENFSDSYREISDELEKISTPLPANPKPAKKGKQSKKGETKEEFLKRRLEQYTYCGQKISSDSPYKTRNCGQPHCTICRKKSSRRNVRKYSPRVKKLENTDLLTFTIKRESPLVDDEYICFKRYSLDDLKEWFNKLMAVQIGKNTLKKWKKWLLNPDLLDKYRKRLKKKKSKGKLLYPTDEHVERRIKNDWVLFGLLERKSLEHKTQGKKLILRNLVKGISHYEPDENGHFHIHTIFEHFLIPELVLCQLWEEKTGSNQVDIRPINRLELRTVLKYIFKPAWGLEKLEKEKIEELLWNINNKPRVQTFNLPTIVKKPKQNNKKWYAIPYNLEPFWSSCDLSYQGTRVFVYSETDYQGFNTS